MKTSKAAFFSDAENEIIFTSLQHAEDTEPEVVRRHLRRAMIKQLCDAEGLPWPPKNEEN